MSAQTTVLMDAPGTAAMAQVRLSRSLSLPPPFFFFPFSLSPSNSLSPLSFSLSMSVVVLLFFSYTQITALDFFYPYTRSLLTQRRYAAGILCARVR